MTKRKPTPSDELARANWGGQPRNESVQRQLDGMLAHFRPLLVTGILDRAEFTPHDSAGRPDFIESFVLVAN